MRIPVNNHNRQCPYPSDKSNRSSAASFLKEYRETDGIYLRQYLKPAS